MTNNIKLIIANANGTLSPHMSILQNACKDAVTICADSIGINDVDIIVLNDINNLIPEVGVGGYTPGRNLVYLYIDAQKELSKNEVYSTICHELHHAKRYEGPGFGTTLFDSMVFEGLACCFEEEVQINESFFLHTIAQYSDAHELIAKYKYEFEDNDFNYREWFITGNKSLPRWAGYRMGYTIAKEYIKKTNKKASELVLEDPKLVYTYWLDTNNT